MRRDGLPPVLPSASRARRRRSVARGSSDCAHDGSGPPRRARARSRATRSLQPNWSSGASAPGRLARQHSMSGHDVRASPHVDDEPERQSTRGPVGGLLAWWTVRGYPKVTFMSRSAPGNLRTVRHEGVRNAASGSLARRQERGNAVVSVLSSATRPPQRTSSTRKMCEAISTGSSRPSSLPCIWTST